MTMLAGLIVERRGDFFTVYSHSGDYEISVAECSDSYEVGSWLGISINKNKIEDHGLLDRDDLPEVRVVQDRAQVLASGPISRSVCKTKEFGCIPLLCHLPSSVSPSAVVQVWARRLTTNERLEFPGLSWGVTEIVAILREAQSPSSSRSTPEADREDDRQLHHSRYADRPTPNRRIERMLADSERSFEKAAHNRWKQTGGNGVRRYKDNAGRRSPSPQLQRGVPHRNDYDGDTDEVVLLGVIFAIVESIMDSEFIGYVWTRDSPQAALLHLGFDDYRRSKFPIGRWIEFVIPADYARAVLARNDRDRPRLELNIEDCRLVRGPLPTFVVNSSIEMEVSASIAVSHQSGAEYKHRDLGFIADPKGLLEGGRDYILRVALNRPMNISIRQQTTMWKILDVMPVSEGWGPRYPRRETKAARPLPSSNRPSTTVQRPSSVLPRPITDRNSTTSNSRADSPDVPRMPPARAQGPVTAPAKLPTSIDGDVRQRVTDVAMVESFNRQKRKYTVWLTKYHVEAELYSNHLLQPGHFFKGRFSIGGKHKSKCHDYLHDLPIPEGVRGYYDTEADKLELYVEGLHKNRKNGACFEVYHEILGYVRDTKNLLTVVDEPTLVPITARRLPCNTENGQLIWQIYRLGFPVLSA